MNEAELRQAAEELQGNWKKFDSFAWRRDDVDQDRWGIVYTHNRDSGLLEQSNARAILEELKPFLEADDPDLYEEDHHHWACGWIKGYCIRPLKDDKVTDVFRKWLELKEQEQQGPLNEEQYRQEQKEDALSSIEHECESHIRSDRQADLEVVYEVIHGWLVKNRPHALEPAEGGGVWPAFQHCLMAMLESNLLDPEDDIVLRDVKVGSYRLQTWDPHGARTNTGQLLINYRFSHPDGWCLFNGDDFGCSPMDSIDGDACLRGLLGFLTLKPGDTDDEYFEKYKPSQMEFAEGDAEDLQMWSLEPDGECEAMPFEDWSNE